MSKYYLLSGLLLPMERSPAIHGFNDRPTIEEKQKVYEEIAEHDFQDNEEFKPPQNYIFLKLSEKDEVRVVYFEFAIL